MSKVETITPYGNTGDDRAKSDQIRDMFDNIAPAYDVMNRLMTLGIDKRWRRKCTAIARDLDPTDILDIAAGTGDLTVALATECSHAKVTGIDLSEEMLAIGRKKIAELKLDDRVTLQPCDALALPFPSDSFDVVTVAFGVRNFQNLDRGLAEMRRVLRPGGTLIILELCTPQNRVVKPFYRFYTRCVIPTVGRLLSKDSRAYSYLPESIAAVPARSTLTDLLTRVEFKNARWKDLTLGVAAIYTATK